MDEYVELDDMNGADDESNPLITPEARATKLYIETTWPHLFKCRLERPLRKNFPKPLSKYYWSMWASGSADVVVWDRRTGKKVAVFEPGGAHHFQDPIQRKRDKKKAKICELNGVRCFGFANSLLDALSNRRKRLMFGRFLFGTKDRAS